MLTVEELLGNPRKYGFPTFAEFAKNPDKFRTSSDDRLARVDESTQTFKHIVERQTYKILGYKVKTLEEVERIAKNEGFDLKNCKFVPQVIPTTAGKCEIIVEFRAAKVSKILDAFGRFFRK